MKHLAIAAALLALSCVAQARDPTQRDARFCARVEQFGLAQYQMALDGQQYHQPWIDLHEKVRQIDPDATLIWAVAQRLITGEGPYGTPNGEPVSRMCLEMVQMNSLPPLHDDQHFVASPGAPAPEDHVGGITRTH